MHQIGRIFQFNLSKSFGVRTVPDPGFTTLPYYMFQFALVAVPILLRGSVRGDFHNLLFKAGMGEVLLHINQKHI